MYKYIDEKGEHLHTYDGKPLLGTSTIVGVVNKPALIQWAANQAVEYVATLWSKDTPYDEAHIQAVLKDARYAHKKKKESAATKGTDMHALLEEYVKECILKGGSPLTPSQADTKVKVFADWAVLNVKRFLWSEMNCYSTSLWVGGISDVGAELLNGKNVIIDFKSSKEAYETQFIQCAGYDLQVSENGGYDSKGVKVLEPTTIDGYVIFPFGGNMQPAFRWNVEEQRASFKACVTLHKHLNK